MIVEEDKGREICENIVSFFLIQSKVDKLLQNSQFKRYRFNYFVIVSPTVSFKTL